MSQPSALLIWGIDLASQCGLAEGGPGTRPMLSHVRFDRSSDDDGMFGIQEKAGRATLWMATRLRDGEKPDAVYYEAPIPERALGPQTNAHSTALKFVLLGAILGPLRAKGIKAVPANIQRVRKHFIGRGNLKSSQAKPLVMARCRALGWAPENHDQSDAAAVWDFGCGQENGGHLLAYLSAAQASDVATPRQAAIRRAEAVFKPTAGRNGVSA
jgi:hypothetical protein